MMTLQNLPNQGERLAQLRSYALDAARSVHNYALPEGQVNEILAKMNLSASLASQISTAQAMATLFAETATAKPQNASAALDNPNVQVASLGWLKGLDFPEARWAGGVGGGGGNGGSSSASYDGMSGKMGDWSSPAGQHYMRNYAIEHGLPWAANNPDLLKLGPAAIDALRDVHLKQESFDRFKKIGLDEKTIVAGAHYSKRNNVDMNESSKQADEIYRGLKSDDRPAFRGALGDLYKCPPGQDDACKADFRKKLDLLKQSNPSMAHKLEQYKGTLHAIEKADQAAAANAGMQVGQDQAVIAGGNNMFGLGPSAEPKSPAPSAAPKSPAASAAPKPPAASAERPAATAGKSAAASAAPAPH